MKSFIWGLILLLCMSGVALSQERDTTTKQSPSVKKQDVTDPAKPIEVTVGRGFSIRLASNPTTGYQWQLATPLDDKILKQAKKTYIKPSVNRPGAGGVDVWKFKAAGEGKATIEMRYVRPWEKDQKPAETALFNVVVSGK